MKTEPSHVERRVFAHCGHFLQSGEIPPEKTGLQSASERGNTLDRCRESLLENVDVDRLTQSHAHSEDGGVTLGQRSGIYVRGIVKPHGKCRFHSCLKEFSQRYLSGKL